MRRATTKRRLLAVLVVSFFSLVTASASAQEKIACAQAAERGQDLRRQGKLRDAQKEWRFAASPSCPPVVRRDAIRWLEELEPSMPTVVVTATATTRAGPTDVTDVRVIVDGEVIAEWLGGRPFSLDPGAHAFVFEREGGRRTESVVIAEGQKNRRVVVRFDEEVAPHPGPATAAASTDRVPRTSAVPYVLAGVGGLALGSFAFFGIKGKSELSGLRDSCAPACSDDEVVAAKRELTIADASLGLAMVSIGAAVLWILVRSPAPRGQ